MARSRYVKKRSTKPKAKSKSTRKPCEEHQRRSRDTGRCRNVRKPKKTPVRKSKTTTRRYKKRKTKAQKERELLRQSKQIMDGCTHQCLN